MGIADIARTVEGRINDLGVRRKQAKGWSPAITGFYGYGSEKRVHVLGRISLEDPEPPSTDVKRGWRQFITWALDDVPVTVHFGSQTIESRSNEQGYVDILVSDHGLGPGWHEATIEAEGAEPVTAQVHIVDPSARYGMVSDIDDTVLVTWLPRAMLAAWNSWVKKTNTRQPVDGMSEFYAELLRDHPETPVFYLSTGAWNTFDTLVNFLDNHGFPKGPLMLTDWGPTPTGLFRSGVEHKKVQLRNLIIEYPEIKWILVGDDGQHDPLTYGDFIFEHPDRVVGMAIRQLSPQEHVLSHGTAAPLAQARREEAYGVRTILGEDGHELLAEYRREPFLD
ncbi:App1 family protein [Corynebacterium sp.]|uniref:App1 family protein n=1 Tax=Corynebacterium sp. TaxID=1720 RepID=UPI0026DF0448|nr:phosphatase domain-containing protein [Corynebacterium sp.]MDO5513524.1 DUF2183 domain-containing protein [Corynebacterium sp.]